MLGEYRSLLANVVLQTNIGDHWVRWRDSSGGYSVRGAYHFLSVPAAQYSEATSELIWHKQVPLKISVLA
jgi:hypothetical protein